CSPSASRRRRRSLRPPPSASLEAQMDGYRVMPMAEAAAIGDVFVTLTGNTHVLRVEHMRAMKDGAVLANSGHFNVEIDLEGLKQVAQGPTRVREFVDEWRMGGAIDTLTPEQQKYLASWEMGT